jgi:hypothetical protein
MSGQENIMIRPRVIVALALGAATALAYAAQPAKQAEARTQVEQAPAPGPAIVQHGPLKGWTEREVDALISAVMARREGCVEDTQQRVTICDIH